MSDKERRHVIASAANEVGRPTLFSMLIIIAAHIPIFALQRHEGRIFQPMALSVTSALIGSLIFSLTLVPLIAFWVLRKGLPHQDNRLVAFCKRTYQPVLAWALGHAKAVIGMALGAFMVAMVAAYHLGSEFLPELNEGTIWVNVRLPASISNDEAAKVLHNVRKALLSGEAFPPSLRDWLAERGVQGYQCYATADVGLIAYETDAREGLVLEEGVIVEIVRPGTGDPVAAGEVGEVVVTSLNPAYPLIRFGTGDLSAVLPGTCPSGRTNTRIRGWMGRADQTTKIRGMFVHPKQVADIVRRFPEVLRARLVVSGAMSQDEMTLKVESASASEGLTARISEAIRDVTKLRGTVELAAPGSLPNDGKVIEDARSYQ
jgi:hypothetical protein